VELACDRPTVVQLIALGHELQHAVEIADAAQVVDAPTLAAHYSRIGAQTNAGSPVLTFETDAARKTSMQVRRELVGVWRTTP
jgi:hypothetical protein